VSASVNLPLHHKVQKFSSGTGSPGWSRKKGCKNSSGYVFTLQLQVTTVLSVCLCTPWSKKCKMPPYFFLNNSVKNEAIRYVEAWENSTPESYKFVHLTYCSHYLEKFKSHFPAVSHFEHSQLQLDKFSEHEITLLLSLIRNCFSLALLRTHKRNWYMHQ